MGKDTCVFCRIINKEIPSRIVFEDSRVLAFEDMHPQAPVHVLVIPKSHIETVADLTDEHIDMIANLVLVAGKIARDKKVQDRGYRIVLNCNKDAGQEVYHIHLHLLGGRIFAWPPG